MIMPIGPLPSLIEAHLFSEGGSLSLKRLMQLTGADEHALMIALDQLSNMLQGSGLSLVRTETEAMLVVAPSASEALKASYEKELGREIGDAGLEVLAIVLYRGPSTRAQIDYIRGVNTSSTIRTLLSRGLIIRTGNPQDGREYVYRPTTELLAHLGATNLKDMPEYATISNELKAFEADTEPFKTEHDRVTTDTDGAGTVAT
ncbi:MAG TPA: SMC-Scp complex subunit ScpB [Candidatus Paceibacterota bacterium]|nr:SMC-Scp complex subunit ScpB [Candidatus Paceibacterota bacterium]